MQYLLTLAGLLNGSPLQCIDVGARGGMQSHWLPFASLIDLDAFEPDPVACERQRRTAPANEHWHPHAIGDKDGPATLYVVRKESSSSLYPPNKPIMDAFAPSGAGDLIREVPINLSRLSTVIEAQKRPSPELIKLDVQGAELDVLRGLDQQHWQSVLGLQVEVEFIEEYLGQCLFWDVDAEIRGKGFVLFDLLPVRLHRVKDGKELYYLKKYLGTGRNRNDMSRRLVAGDALYLRSPESMIGADQRIAAKYLLILLIYRCFDEALWFVEELAGAGKLDKKELVELTGLVRELAPRPDILQRSDWLGRQARKWRKRLKLGAQRKQDFWLSRSWDF